MLRFSQPAPKPDNFDAEIQPFRYAIAAIIAKGAAPLSADFKDAWTEYKGSLAAHQHGKCGFCEALITPVAAGDVEHYRPKSALGALDDDPATWGEEDEHLNRVGRSRSITPLCPRGYWWLAYEWSNYLFACESCNQKWKRTLFPVAESPRTLPPSQGVTETCLLLNPYDPAVDPAAHLRFSDIGTIEARSASRWGFETIRTCHLDRGSLTRARAADASRATDLARRMRRAQKDLRTSSGDVARRELALALHDLLLLGEERRPFAGMVRIIARDITACSWDQLVELRKRFVQPPAP